MNELQQNRYDQIIRRVGGIVGPGSKVAEALSELFPVIDLERVPGELLILGGTKLCWGSINLSGGAGASARTQLFNPIDSGILITVSRVLISVDTGQTIRIGITNAALTTGVATQLFRDIRGGPTQRPTGEIRSQASVAESPATVTFRLQADVTFDLRDENSVAVLTPGFGMEVGANDQATQISAAYFWRERPSERSETNF